MIYLAALLRIFVFRVASTKIPMRQGNRENFPPEKILDLTGIEPILSSILNWCVTSQGHRSSLLMPILIGQIEAHRFYYTQASRFPMRLVISN